MFLGDSVFTLKFPMYNNKLINDHYQYIKILYIKMISLIILLAPSSILKKCHCNESVFW